MKPAVVPNVLQEVKSIASNKLFISVAMGITINQMENVLPNNSRIIRVMPNTPALVNQGQFHNINRLLQMLTNQSRFEF